MKKQRQKFFLIFLIVLFFIISCGIPSYLSCNASLKHNSSDGSYTASIVDFHINADPYSLSELISQNQIETTSPSITFFYTITNSISDASLITNGFNSNFSSENRRPKSASISSATEPVVTYTSSSDDKTLGLYIFGSGNWSSFSGHLNRQNENGGADGSFKFFINEQLTEDGKIIQISYNDNAENLDLTRYNGESFTINSGTTNDYSFVSSDEQNYYINIYCAMNVIGSGTATFTNRLWTDLYLITSIEI